MDLAGHWADLQSNTVIRMFGITLTGQISIVTEYVRHGPLNQYLQKHKGTVKQVDLIEAAANLASALWHLVCFYFE